MFHLEKSDFPANIYNFNSQKQEEFGSSDEDYWLASTHSRRKKKKGILEDEVEPEEEIEPDMETLSAVIKLEVENFY
jgi:hypothetical protein